jgi:hypothetical protein
MKKIFVLLLGILSFSGFSQMSLAKLDGTPIINGDVFTFSSAEDPDSYFGIKIYNTSENRISVKVKCENIINADGTNVQLCLGDVCLSSLTPGNSYPNNPAIIEANASNGNFDHFLNLNSGINTNAPVQYDFKFFQVDENGTEIGNSVSFSYRFVSALGVSNFNALAQSGVSLKSNIVTNELEMSATKNVQYNLYDIAGKSVMAQNISAGDYRLDVSNLNAGVYILFLQNNEGQKASVRIIKR